MDKIGRIRLILLLAALSAGLTIAGSTQKPDLTGTWILNLEKSRLQIGDKIESGTFTIEHQEPQFRFSRVFLAGGREDSTSYALTTDGKEKIENGPGRTTSSRLYWDGDVLVLDERIVLKDGRQATNVVRYSLQEGGRTLVAEEKFRGPIRKYDNHWVADRKSPSRGSSR